MTTTKPKSTKDPKKFYGPVILSIGIRSLTKEYEHFSDFCVACFQRHIKNDFGELCKDDRKVQKEIIKNNYQGNIWSTWTEPQTKIKVWIITSGYGNGRFSNDPNCCYTTIMEPSEY
tara:strand:+ start:104 stop:454 length:351 start_codon:yes stop_codon:yes gene_type:complete